MKDSSKRQPPKSNVNHYIARYRNVHANAHVNPPRQRLLGQLAAWELSP